MPTIRTIYGIFGIRGGQVALLDVIVGYDCNLGCDYCTIWGGATGEGGPRGSLSTRAIASALGEGRAAGYDRVSFTGGEPTLRPDLIPLVRHARALGYAGVKVQTNGLLLAHPPNRARLLAAGVDLVHLSIHCHEAEGYERIVRRPGTHSAMVTALRGLAAADVELVADVILDEDTYRGLPAAVDWLHDQGVRAADLWFVSLTDANRHNVGSMPRMTSVVPLMREAFARGRAHGMRVRSLHVPRCLLGDDHPHAWDPAAEGVRVVTPEATFELTGSKLTGQLHVPACRGCRFEAICPGLRADYLDRYGGAEISAARGWQSPGSVSNNS